MASSIDREKANCTITWIIENVSFCWQKTGEQIQSPVFVADNIENTKWTLYFYPRGSSNGNYIGYYLHREDDGTEAETMEIGFELAILEADGSVFVDRNANNYTFEKNKKWGWSEFAERDDVFTLKRSWKMREDSLTARCRIWKTNEKAKVTRRFFAKTIMQVERQTFVWGIEKFSSLEPDQENRVVIKSASGVVLLTCDLHLIGGLCEEETINIDIVCSDERMKNLKFQTFLVNSKGSKTDCGRKEFLFESLRRGEFTLLLSKKQLIGQKSFYLPNDVLTLNCECAFSTGVALEGFDLIDFGNISPLTKNEVATNVDERDEESLSNALLNGFEFLYKNEILCDIKLSTKTETFPVHSVLLCAISPVFRAMFTTDMKEKTKESVDIADVDADTLRQMLQYVYTDTLEIRDWKNATLLYAAADKYDIKSMKKDCSSYLKNNFCPANACQILVLSDMHHDKDLKNTVADYILKQGGNIFESNEWIRFMEENSKLAADTMQRNWTKRKVVL